MDLPDFENVKRRYDPDLCQPFLASAQAKEAMVFVLWGSKRFSTRIRSVVLGSDPPYITLDSFMPEKGNGLARDRQEVSARFHYIQEGSMYVVRFKLLLHGIQTENGISIIFSTPPLDLRFITQSYTAKPTLNLRLFVKFSLKGKDIHLGVRAVSMSGLVLESHLAASSLDELKKIGHLRLQFKSGKEIDVPGTFREAGSRRLEYRFRNLEDSVRQDLESYLERSLTEEEITLSEKKVPTPKRKAVRHFRILVLTKDMEYVKCLQPEFESEAFEFVVESTEKGFQDQLIRRGWNFIAMDAQAGIDLETALKNLKACFQGRSKAPPPVVLLTGVVSRSVVEKARDWGFDHVFSRSIFGWTPIHEIGSILGHRLWIDAADTKRLAVLIDDDRESTYYLEHALRCYDFTPLLFQTGSEGVRAVEEYQPDYVFLDTDLKNKDGLDACRILKKLPSTKQIPLIIVTRQDDIRHKDAILQTGVEIILKKPIDAFQLVQKVVGSSSR